MGRRIPTALTPGIPCPTCRSSHMDWVETGTAMMCSGCYRTYRIEDGELVRVRGLHTAFTAVLRSIRDLSSLH